MAMEKLKGLADKPAPLPVVSSRTKYQHISNRDLSITNGCARTRGHSGWVVLNTKYQLHVH